MLELLDPQGCDKILDIGGCGSGWTTALIAEYTQSHGTVTSLEMILELIKYGRKI